MEGILPKSARLRKDGQRLLEKTDLLPLLGKYGEVELTGSFVLDLMVTPDIDIHLVNPSITKKKAVALLNDLIDGDSFRAACYATS